MTDSRTLPDPNSSLYESRDFILGSPLARRALESSFPILATFISDLLDATHRLSQACHLPEFTDHGLPHLCSLVDRVSHWELSGSRTTLPESLEPDDARNLLVATLVHDLGMLSQKAIDLPPSHSSTFDPSQWSDIASWVRRTHVMRLQKLISRVMGTYSSHYAPFFLRNEKFNLCDSVDIAMAHQKWPWDWSGEWQNSATNRGIAAVVSVADLLDEDSARCDTETLLEHRGGNELNRAHWIRHVLTAERVMVNDGAIRVELRKPPNTGQCMKPVYSALRNHFRLVLLYEKDLNSINAPIVNVDLAPSTGIPRAETALLHRWNTLDGFDNESAFTFQLLRTFMPEAIRDDRRCDVRTLMHLRCASLEDVDLSILSKAQMLSEPRTEAEQTFEAILGGEE